MSFPRYPAYKDSGVEWLGQVPEHWVVDCLKYRCEVFPSNIDKHLREDEPAVQLCNYTDVYYNEVITHNISFMPSTAKPEQIEKFRLRRDDVIITKDSESADDIAVAAYVPEDLPGVVCGYHLSMIRPRKSTSGAFVKRLFDSEYAKARFEISANGLTRVGLGQYALNNVKLPFPPHFEQMAIANFLDHETAKIDALIAEQKKLIELLKEKRQAVISHTVTKGLDPNVKMKDSGVEWLGQVPSHWHRSKVKYLFRLGRGRVIAQELVQPEGLYPVFSSQTQDDGCMGYLDTYDFDCDQITWTTDGVNAGTVFLRKGKHSCTNVCGTLFPRTEGFDLRYLYYFLSYATQFYKRPDTNGAKIMNGEMAEIFILLPDLEKNEQKEIVEFLDHETAKFDTLIAEQTKAVSLLQERRSALISAVVTGQIDVRNFTPEAEPA